jgi:alpha-mannosidase
VPLRVLADGPGGGKLAPSVSWFRIDAPEIVIATVKQAEDGQGLIVRLYESACASTRGELACGFVVAEAAETNLIEEEPKPLDISQPAASRVSAVRDPHIAPETAALRRGISIVNFAETPLCFPKRR